MKVAPIVAKRIEPSYTKKILLPLDLWLRWEISQLTTWLIDSSIAAQFFVVPWLILTVREIVRVRKKMFLHVTHARDTLMLK